MIITELSQVVDGDSAKLGLGHEATSSIASNHREMTKFHGPEDSGFKRVGAKLLSRVEEIRANDLIGQNDNGASGLVPQKTNI